MGDDRREQDISAELLLAAVREARVAYELDVLSGLNVSSQLARMRSKILGIVEADRKSQRVDQEVSEMTCHKDQP